MQLNYIKLNQIKLNSIQFNPVQFTDFNSIDHFHDVFKLIDVSSAKA